MADGVTVSGAATNSRSASQAEGLTLKPCLGYCADCGTWDAHGRFCAACGYDFTPESLSSAAPITVL